MNQLTNMVTIVGPLLYGLKLIRGWYRGIPVMRDKLILFSMKHEFTKKNL